MDAVDHDLSKDAVRYRWILRSDAVFNAFMAAYYNKTDIDEINAEVDAAIYREFL